MDVFFILLRQHWTSCAEAYFLMKGDYVTLCKVVPSLVHLMCTYSSIFHLNMIFHTYDVNVSTEKYMDKRLCCWETHIIAKMWWNYKSVMSSDSNGVHVYSSQNGCWHCQVWQSMFILCKAVLSVWYRYILTVNTTEFQPRAQCWQHGYLTLGYLKSWYLIHLRLN